MSSLDAARRELLAAAEHLLANQRSITIPPWIAFDGEAVERLHRALANLHTASQPPPYRKTWCQGGSQRAEETTGDGKGVCIVCYRKFPIGKSGRLPAHVDMPKAEHDRYARKEGRS